MNLHSPEFSAAAARNQQRCLNQAKSEILLDENSNPATIAAKWMGTHAFVAFVSWL
jgi:hypothetical protein